MNRSTFSPRVILPILLIVVLIPVSAMYYHSLRQVDSLKFQLSEYDGKLGLLESKSEADDLIFKGEADEAIQRYALLAGEHPDDFEAYYRQRLQWLSDYRRAMNTRRQPVVIKEKESGEKDKDQEMRMAYESELEARNNEIDSLMLNMAELNERIRIMQGEKQALADKQQAVFVNPKGYRVVYLGEIRNGMANGHGVGVWNTGSIYEGEWKDNQRHGEGAFEWADGERYEGGYADDKRSGWGVYYWKNGERYEGNWSEDSRNGKGTLYDKSGKEKLSGSWKNDQLASSSKSGSGSK